MPTWQIRQPQASSTPQNVLVIEDDADARNNLIDILELDGYTVRSAESLAEAVRSHPWENLLAIVLDRRLPDGTAETILPRLQELAPSTPVIIVTGFGDLEGAISAVRQGAVDYILKPINADALRSRLAKLVELQDTKEALLAAQQKALQSERLAAIGQMMTGLAHESRNALQRSQACLEMLALEVQDRPAALDLVARIQKAQDHLHALYEEVRDYAAPIRLAARRSDLKEILRQTWEHLSLARVGRQTRLQIDDTQTHDTRCMVDARAIEQVFRNLLENALSACKDPVEIRVRFQDCFLREEPAIDVAVSDNGPGLSEEAQRRIFEPFFTTKSRGTGLGMAISNRIVEAHGGNLRVVPTTGGACIAMILPREPG